MYVAIAGNVGVGKSTLTTRLAERYGLEPIFEAVDENPYLSDFYADMPRWAFHSQTFFLAERLRQHLRQVNPGERVVQDRTIYEDADVFARALWTRGVMDARDWASYRRLYDAIAATLRPPDLLVYLRASLPTLQARIARRGRGYERDIDADYLATLNTLYDDFAVRFGGARVVTIDADALDFVGREADFEALCVDLERHGLTPPVMRG